MMAWGVQRKFEVIERVEANDDKLTTVSVMSMRRITDDQCKQLLTALKGNTHVKDFSISRAFNDDLLRGFADMLAENATLTTLSPGNSSLGDAGFAALLNGIVASKSLQSLNMEHRGLTPESASAIRACFFQSHLRHLNLASNTLTGALAAALSQRQENGGAARVSGLEELNLSSTSLTAHDGRALAAAISAGHLPSLTTLDLSNNAMLGAAACDVLRAAAASSHVTTLDLSSTGMGGSGGGGGVDSDDVSGVGAALLDAFSSPNSQLKVLKLESCGLTRAALSPLTAARLESPARLAVFSLAANDGVKDVDLVHIVTKVVHAECLDLGQCGLSPGQAAAIIQALPASTRKCRLFGNAIIDTSDDDVNALLDATCAHLEDLDLGGYGLSQE
ncbi:hypothetical protein PTSG_08649 [Salpingoeca rosetta]|uniref:NOD3 protein n=1 Tax=Salpingoeca rosetta (strain ATCC 50818 / BSB-021) TaxID=946362 RepID=F2UKA2_SALR5|nr:uncharacterized protein PTSG_08649 [Salpingoeca rosetta]EGD77551.1 hypothetical protein PTSG_08649 [Salpingoeca rosetta]|eukprot:XP_004990439.1 hypothetical protein PTSG_08649 [Salpingoeca rosetta]